MKNTDFEWKFGHNCVDSVVTVFTVQADIDSDTVELFDSGDWFLFWDLDQMIWIRFELKFK